MSRRAERREERGPWYLLTGLILGIGLGILYAWVISPVEFIDTAPASLAPEFKEKYRLLIAQAYDQNKDLGRARQRINLLEGEQPSQALNNQAEQLLASDSASQEALVLKRLASDLALGAPGVDSTPAAGTVAATGQPEQDGLVTPTTGDTGFIFTATPAPTQEFTPAPTFTPRALATQPAALSQPFALQEKQEVCTKPGGQITIETLDNTGQPLAGVRIDITWQGGQETFFTGLNPKVSPGYADFAMEAGQVYNLRVGEGGETIGELVSQSCQDADGQTSSSGWALVFRQP